MGEPIGIIGAGITGLACAYKLACKHNVTIVARDIPGDLGTEWASPWAGAVFHPQSEATRGQQEMQRDSFNFYWSLAQEGSCSGVQKLPMTEYFDGAAENLSIWYKSLMPDYRVIPSDDLPEGVLYGVKYSSLAINPSSVLPWLKEKLVAKGVSFVRAEVKSFDEARKITKARLIIHASGVSASKLAADKNALPVRGQTMFVKSDFNELVMREGSDYTYVIPRPGSGGVILGGIKSDRLDTAVDVALKGDILKRVNEITNGAFKDIDLDSVKDIVAFRPGRTGGIRVEREGNVVHAYGAGGAGYIYSFGVAERVRKLIEDERNVSKL